MRRAVAWLWLQLTGTSAERCAFPNFAHTWKAAEPFPVCENCGASCWWAGGYQLGLSGLWMGPDHDALALMTEKPTASPRF